MDMLIEHDFYIHFMFLFFSLFLYVSESITRTTHGNNWNLETQFIFVQKFNKIKLFKTKSQNRMYKAGVLVIIIILII